MQTSVGHDLQPCLSCCHVWRQGGGPFCCLLRCFLPHLLCDSLVSLLVRFLACFFGSFFELAFGLETSSDRIRRDSINKGFTFEDFIRAAETARKNGATVKAYLMLKPPFLSERQAMEDIIRSIDDAAPYADTISINLCNVQKGTLVDRDVFSAVGSSQLQAVALCRKQPLAVVSGRLLSGCSRTTHGMQVIGIGCLGAWPMLLVRFVAAASASLTDVGELPGLTLE